MRVGYLVSRYPAPSHTFVRREVEALRGQGLEIETFSVRRPAAADRLGDRDHEEIARTFFILPASPATIAAAHARAFASRPARYLSALALALRHREPGLRALLWSIFYFVEAIVLARALERRAVEHLHNHFANAAASVGLIAAHHLGLGWSFTVHGISEFDGAAGPLLAAKLGAARFVACASWFVMAQAMRMSEPAHWPKLLLVRCGIEPASLPARPPRETPPRVVFVGRLSAEKGCVGLIEAFAALAARTDAHLRLVGDGPHRALVEERIRAHGLEGRCTLLGQLQEPEALREIASADVLVSASLMEGLPVVLMEALALEVPVVAPRLAGIPELIEDGVTGLLYTPARWDELSACLGRLLADPDLRRKLGQAGRARVLEEFQIGRAVEPLHGRFRGMNRA